MRSTRLVVMILPALFILLAVVAGCDTNCPAPSSTTPPPDKSATEKKNETANIKLEQSSSGGVLILDEGEESKKTVPSGDEGLSGKKRPRPPFPAFRDQHVKLYAADVTSALPEAVRLAAASGAQVINYPIKGFENMGPNEKTLVFDYRTFGPYLKKLSSLGRIEHPKIERSEFVTVRLTVLSEESGN